MELEEVLLKRRSIRKFKDIEVENSKINKILYYSMAAPSARNIRPWEIFVIRNKKVIEEIKKSSPNYNYDSSLIMVVCANLDSVMDGENGYSVQDASSIINHILLEACNLGLGTVWCGIFPREERVKDIKRILNLSESFNPIGLVHIGYPNEELDKRTQFETDKIHYID